MSQALTTTNGAALAPAVTDDQIELVRRTVANGATQAELELYLYDCQRHGVHPLDRLLHFTKRGGRYTPITSIDLFRSRAEATGELAGIDDPQYKGDPMTAEFQATVTVWRIVQGQRYPWTATARWPEYKPEKDDFMWRKMPHLMLGKCAEALSLRKAFPRQLSGIYVREEMDQAENTGARYTPPPALPAEQAAGDAPICPEHNQPMRPGKNGGWYCPTKHGEKWYSIKDVPVVAGDGEESLL